MQYEKYLNARNSVWQLIIDMNINRLPVDVLQICKNIDITVKYENFADNSDGKSYILLKEDAFKQRKCFTIAHELGHLFLEHVGKYELVNRDGSEHDSPIEQEANEYLIRAK